MISPVVYRDWCGVNTCTGSGEPGMSFRVKAGDVRFLRREVLSVAGSGECS